MSLCLPACSMPCESHKDLICCMHRCCCGHENLSTSSQILNSLKLSQHMGLGWTVINYWTALSSNPSCQSLLPWIWTGTFHYYIIGSLLRPVTQTKSIFLTGKCACVHVCEKDTHWHRHRKRTGGGRENYSAALCIMFSMKEIGICKCQSVTILIYCFLYCFVLPHLLY